MYTYYINNRKELGYMALKDINLYTFKNYVFYIKFVYNSIINNI